MDRRRQSKEAVNSPSTSGILNQDDPNLILDGKIFPGLVGSRPATTEQIRDVKPITDAMFEIGKPGGEFENGIKDIDTAKQLAKALGAAFYIVGKQKS